MHLVDRLVKRRFTHLTPWLSLRPSNNTNHTNADNTTNTNIINHVHTHEQHIYIYIYIVTYFVASIWMVDLNSPPSRSILTTSFQEPETLFVVLSLFVFPHVYSYFLNKLILLAFQYFVFFFLFVFFFKYILPTSFQESETLRGWYYYYYYSIAIMFIIHAITTLEVY